MKPVTIYVKDFYCPYCDAAKKLLTKKKVKFTEIDFAAITTEERELLLSKTLGYTSVPQIFIDDKFIGGFDQLSELEKSGKLDAMLKD